jgi:hypothetical protein
MKPGIRNKGNTKPIKKPVIDLDSIEFETIPVKSKRTSAATNIEGISSIQIDGIFCSSNFQKKG